MDILLLLVCVLACTLLLVATGALLLYIIPVRSSIRVILDEGRLRETVTVGWWFVAVRIAHDPERTSAGLLILDHALYTRDIGEAEEPASRPEEEKERPEPHQPRPGVNISGVKRLVSPAFALLSVIWRESRFDSLHGRVTFGLDDPVLTGEMYGYYWASRFALESLRIRLEVEPVFDREVFGCDLEVRISLRRPLLVVIGAVHIMLHPAAREMMAGFRQNPAGAVAA